MRDAPRQIDDGVAKAVGMVEGQDRFEILQQQLFDELLEERLEPISDRLGVHDGAADALEIGQDGAQAPGELVDLVARFAQRQRHLALLAVDDLRVELFDGFEIEADGDDQAAEPLRDVLVQARQPLNHQQRPHRHVDGDAQAVLLLLEPAPAEQPPIDLARDQKRLVGLFRRVCAAVALDAPAAGRNHLRQRLAEIVVLVPERRIGPHDVVDRMRRPPAASERQERR